jgi:2-methylisocitrate lyase-like PEP mutase family enzyme
VDARDEGAGILILARTDAAALHGLDDAIDRAKAFRDAGADILFVEAPKSESELERVARALEGAPLMANLVEGGDTPLLPPARLEALGFRIAAYPLTLLSVSVQAIAGALARMRAGGHPAESERVSFAALRELVGFPAYDEAAKRYAAED